MIRPEEIKYNFPWMAKTIVGTYPWEFVLRPAAQSFNFFFFSFCAGWAGAVGSGLARASPEASPCRSVVGGTS